jgi:hypothetical protein
MPRGLNRQFKFSRSQVQLGNEEEGGRSGGCCRGGGPSVRIRELAELRRPACGSYRSAMCGNGSADRREPVAPGGGASGSLVPKLHLGTHLPRQLGCPVRRAVRGRGEAQLRAQARSQVQLGNEEEGGRRGCYRGGGPSVWLRDVAELRRWDSGGYHSAMRRKGSGGRAGALPSKKRAFWAVAGVRFGCATAPELRRWDSGGYRSAMCRREARTGGSPSLQEEGVLGGCGSSVWLREVSELRRWDSGGYRSAMRRKGSGGRAGARPSKKRALWSCGSLVWLREVS